MLFRTLSVALGVIARNVIDNAHIGIFGAGFPSHFLRAFLFEYMFMRAFSLCLFTKYDISRIVN